MQSFLQSLSSGEENRKLEVGSEHKQLKLCSPCVAVVFELDFLSKKKRNVLAKLQTSNTQLFRAVTCEHAMCTTC